MLTASDMTNNRGYFLTEQTRASPIPVLPLVASMTVFPGKRSPDFFTGLNHGKGGSVFDGSGRIEIFHLGQQGDSGIGIQIFNLNQGGCFRWYLKLKNSWNQHFHNVFLNRFFIPGRINNFNSLRFGRQRGKDNLP